MIDTLAIRNKILILAFQGRLVAQGAFDEPASSMVASYSRKINGKYQSIDFEKEDIPFEIPESWCWCKLSDISFTNIGLTYHPEDIDSEGTIVIRSSNIINGKVDYTDLVRVNCIIRENQYLNKNDIVICVRNGSKAHVGKNAIFEGESRTVAFGAFMAVLRTPYYRYVYYYLNTPIFRKYFYNDDTKQINQVTQNILKQALIPMPPLEEQERIVDKITQLFEILDYIDRLQTQYSYDIEVLKFKLIDAGIRGKLTEQFPEDGNADDLYQNVLDEKQCILRERKGREDKNIRSVGKDIPFEIPSYWKWIRFGEVGLFKKGPFGSALTKSMFVPKGDNTVKVYEQQHAIQKNPTLGTYYITGEYFDEKMSGFEVKAGDILVSCAGTIGETYILPNGIEKGIINQALMRITLAESIDKRFFLYFFDSNLKKSAQNESNGSAIKNIPPFDVMKNWYFPLPPSEEQRRIADKIDELLQYCQ